MRKKTYICDTIVIPGCDTKFFKAKKYELSNYTLRF